jgi:NADPH:quinone reductase-like Zn-dependent oxidoreductase
MRAVYVRQYGDAEPLAIEEVPDPVPQIGQVLVRVRAASVNPWDLKLASGRLREQVAMTLPYVPGGDFSGSIEALGGGVSGVSVGEAVYGTCPSGAYAQRVLVSPLRIAPKPRSLSHAEAAAVPVAAQTAWQGLFDHGLLQSGQTVLIHAGAGGVGSFAVQLARWKGAHVVATASANHTAFVRGLGAADVIDYNAGPFESMVGGVDLVLDLVGGETQERSFAVLKGGGRLISTVTEPRQSVAKRADVLAALFRMRSSRNGLNQLAELIDAGGLKVHAHVQGLESVDAAWKQSLSSHTQGKIVLEVPV